MKKNAGHIKVRPDYYRGNFDYDEGPYNRVNRPGDDVVSDDVMIVSEEDLNDIKEQDLSKKRSQHMKIEMITDEEKYPDTTKPAQKNDLFKQDKSYYEKVYTDREKELNKVTTRENGRDMRVMAGHSKLAIIRGEEVRDCPFGLPITKACQNAGEAIHRMAPLSSTEDEEEQQKIIKANKMVYVYHKTGERCPYADKIMEVHNKVDCDFADTGEGLQSTPFRGSPLYPSTFYGIGLDGLYGYPLGFYADNNESRNLFFGLFSLLGYGTKEELIKLADEYDKADELEKADIVDGLVKKLKDMKDKYGKTFDKVEKYLSKYRQKYEAERADPGLLWELSDAWFGPRQVNR